MEKKDSASSAQAEKKYHLDAFERVSDEKKERIYRVATAEFAQHGFTGANINSIAKNAQISIGALYKYFRSKEDLFLGIVDNAYGIMKDIFRGIDLGDGDIFEKYENILRAAQQFARDYPELNQFYLCIASEDIAHLSKRLSRKVETITAHYYLSLIEEAKKQNLVSPEIDDRVAAFCMDNLVLLTQYSYTSAYFGERMKIYIGENAQNEDERIISGISSFLRRALTATTGSYK